MTAVRSISLAKRWSALSRAAARHSVSIGRTISATCGYATDGPRGGRASHRHLWLARRSPTSPDTTAPLHSVSHPALVRPTIPASHHPPPAVPPPRHPRNPTPPL